ncbi:MAG: hypothetical protein ABSC21_24050 [Terriglobia bacterium]|jgi:hypothetical protein
MGKRQRDWARRWRARLVSILGSRCACCGSGTALELDCIRPPGRQHARLEASARVTFYRQQFRNGNLQLLCKTCNVTKADRLLTLLELLREVNKSNNSISPQPPARYEKDTCE